MSHFELTEDKVIKYSQDEILMEFVLKEAVDLLNAYNIVLNNTLKRAKLVDKELYENIRRDMVKAVLKVSYK